VRGAAALPTCLIEWRVDPARAAALAEAAVARGDPARTPLWFAELLAARSSPPADQSMLPE